MEVPHNQSAGQRFVIFLATGFGAGRLPHAPGTYGTLVAIPFYLVLMGAPPLAYFSIVVLLFVLGVMICSVAETAFAAHDHPAIVWDEIVGFLVTMFLAPPGWSWIVIGFLLFRVFDIWKPFPIGMLDRRVPGGLGSMLDDAAAGVLGFFVLQVLAWLFVSGE